MIISARLIVLTLTVFVCSLQATAQMEERLLEIVTHYSPDSSLRLADGVLGFIQHQLVELVRDCLDKSQNGLVTSRYFVELQEKLDKLLHEVRIPRSDTAEVYLLGGWGVTGHHQYFVIN